MLYGPGARGALYFVLGGGRGAHPGAVSNGQFSSSSMVQTIIARGDFFNNANCPLLSQLLRLQEGEQISLIGDAELSHRAILLMANGGDASIKLRGNSAYGHSVSKKP